MAEGFVTVAGSGGVVTADKAQLDITGDLTIIACVAADDWTPAADGNIMAKWEGGTQRSYAMLLKTAGTIQMPLSDDGATATFPAATAIGGVVDGEHVWIRHEYDTDGVTTRTCHYEHSFDPISTPIGSINWTATGGDDTAGTFLSLFNSTAPLVFGNRNDGTTANGLVGKLFVMGVYDGIEGAGGTLVANPDFRVSAPGADGLGNTWALVGDAFWTAGDLSVSVGAAAETEAAQAVAVDAVATISISAASETETGQPVAADAGAMSASLYATATQTIVDVVDELDTTIDLHLSVDDDPDTPNDADWVNNAVAVV